MNKQNKIGISIGLYFLVLIITTIFTIDIKSIDYFSGTLTYIGLMSIFIELNEKK